MLEIKKQMVLEETGKNLKKGHWHNIFVNLKYVILQ